MCPMEAMNELTVMVNLVKNTDMLKEMNGNSPEIGSATEATVGQETVMTLTVNMNTIASTITQINMKKQMKKHPAQKFYLQCLIKMGQRSIRLN
jgi:hypothetical protein